MNILLNEDTIQRWEHESGMFQAEMKDAAEKDALALANSPNFSVDLRNEVDKLDLDDFRGQGDLAFSTRCVVEHPVFDDMLRELLDKHNLLDMDDDYLSDAAEAYITVFFNVLWKCLAEFEKFRLKS